MSRPRIAPCGTKFSTAVYTRVRIPKLTNMSRYMFECSRVIRYTAATAVCVPGTTAVQLYSCTSRGSTCTAVSGYTKRLQLYMYSCSLLVYPDTAVHVLPLEVQLYSCTAVVPGTHTAVAAV